MRRTATWVVMSLVILASCKNKDQFTIDGKIESAGGIKKVMLYQTDQLVDSAFLNTDNEFKFKRSNPDPDFYTLSVGEKNYPLIAQNGDEIEFSANLSDSTGSYILEGSEGSEKIKEFNQLSQKYGKIYTDLQKQYDASVIINPNAKDSIFNSMVPVFQKNMDAFAKESLEFGEKNKDNLAGFYAVGSIDQASYELELIAYAEKIKSLFPKNKAVQAFVSKMEGIKPVSVGQAAPLFELPTADNKMVKLSDFKGKYVLLDFWASWCAPCRLENPNIVKLYNTYKSKGFEVFGVSLDDEKEAWLNAVETDKLAWTQVSDLKTWYSQPALLYKVEAIPSSFMIDPSGKIVAKNLKGIMLEEFLKKTLK